MARLPGAKNRSIEMTLPSWYGEKLKSFVLTLVSSRSSFLCWLLRNTVQILCGQREPSNQKLGDSPPHGASSAAPGGDQ